MPRYSAYGSRDDRVKEDGDRGFIGFNNRLRPDQLKPGILADSQNARMGLNGQWEVRKGIDEITTPVSTSAALTIPCFIRDTTINSASINLNTPSSGDIQINFASAHEFKVGATSTPATTTTTGDIELTNLSGIDPAVADGPVPITVVDADSVKITDQTYTAAPSGTVVLGKLTIDDDDIEGIKGSCAFSDPNDSASQYVIMATNTKAIAFNLITKVSTDITYPTGITIPSEVDMLQAFNKVFIFRNGSTALEWNGSFSGSPAFTKVESGDYTQPVTGTATSFAISNGVATVGIEHVADSTNALFLKNGDNVRVSVVGDSGLTLDDEFIVIDVTAGTPDTFTFIVNDAPDITDGSVTSYPKFIKKLSVGLGFTHMPAPPFAIYHQRRLVMPNNFTVDSSDDSFTANGKLDEVIASDILDTDTYDQIFANFRFNAGTADFIVGLHSFSEDTLLVFNRNSIHLIQNSQVLNQATSKLLTDEVGCLARKSIQQIGNQILFLSDNGVYGVGFIEGYQLRGTEIPLSESIDATIKRINKSHQSKAISVYFDNRYYLAVPLDDSTQNNAIIIYNFLNQQWESIDTVNASGFNITNMFVAGDGQENGVYTVNDLGGINLLESRVDGKDNITTVIGGTVQTPQILGVAKTRQFTFNNLDRKKWRSFEMHVESQSDLDSNFDIDAELENLDKSLEVGTLRGFNNDSVLQAGSDISIRGRLGNPRAYGIQLDINNTVGRPKLRAVSVNGIESFRAVDKAE